MTAVLPWCLALLVGGLMALAGHRIRQLSARLSVARQRRGQLPDALERMASGLRTGSSLSQALADAGRTLDPPLGPELAELAQRIDAGQPLLVVLDGWAATREDSDTRLATTALVLATRIGAAPARALDGVAATLRDRIRLSAERRAQATQARYSALVLSVAPLGFTGLLVATNSAAASFLLATPAGWACLLAGLGLDAAGAAWMAHLTDTSREAGQGALHRRGSPVGGAA